MTEFEASLTWWRRRSRQKEKSLISASFRCHFGIDQSEKCVKSVSLVVNMYRQQLNMTETEWAG
jgi:hypothetical protein